MLSSPFRLVVAPASLVLFLLLASAAAAADFDGDGIDDAVDNCVDITNPAQTDIDFDTFGDPDPTLSDGVGDACQNYGDADLDGIRDLFDNCRLDANISQIDTDTDGFGNACDGDFDNDGDEDATDRSDLDSHLGCVATGPPFDALYDLDGDGCVDSTDQGIHDSLALRELTPGPADVPCADTASPTSPCSFPAAGDQEVNPDPQITTLGDGFGNELDNCPFEYNATQTDTDFDGFGNRCDADFNNTATVNVTDFNIFISCYGADPADEAINALGKPCTLHDFDDSNSVDVTDYNLFLPFFTGSQVAVSGIACAGAPCPLPAPPVLDPVGNQSIAVGSTLTVQLTATDPNGDSVSFAAFPQPLPDSATFDTATGAFAFVPSPGQGGVINLTFSASDGVDSDSESITITVAAPQAGDPTSFSGRLLDANAIEAGFVEAVVNARVSLFNTGFHTQTDASGYFTLDTTTDDTPLVQSDNVVFPSGAQVFDINTVAPAPDTADVASDGSTLSSFREAITLIDGAANVVSRPFYLTRIDDQFSSIVDHTVQTTVTNDDLGVTMVIPIDSARNEDGSFFDQKISISLVPAGWAPAALPPELEPTFLLTIQPVGLTFSPPARVTFPNLDGLPVDTSAVNLWSLDAATGTFVAVAAGIVTPDGSEIETPAGSGILSSSWHCMCSDGQDQSVAENQTENQTASDDEDEDDSDCSQAAAPDVDAAEQGLGSRVVLGTGALRESHTLVPYRSLGRARALRFVYDSTRADPQPIIRSDLTILKENALPETFSTRRVVSGVTQGPDVYLSPVGPVESLIETQDETILTARQFDAVDFPTGRYPYRFWQRSNYAASTISSIELGFVLVNNQSDSHYGAGWGLDGVQRIHAQSGGDVVLTDGNGGTLVFTPSNSLVIGGFDTSRSNHFSFKSGDQFDKARASLAAAFPTVSFTEFPAISEASLSGVDVVVLSSHATTSDNSFWIGGAITDLTQAEKDALWQFVEDGGRALLMGDAVLSNSSSANSLLGVFGVSIATGTNTNVTAVPTAPTHPVFGGPFAVVADYRALIYGRISGLGSDADLIAAGPGGDDVLAAIEEDTISPGSGRVLLHSAPAFYSEGMATEDTFDGTEDLLLNEMSYLSVNLSGAARFDSPSGDFSMLERNSDNTFTRTVKGGTVHQFDAQGLHVSTTDSNGNLTQFIYDSQTSELIEIVDPVGQSIFLNYSGGLLVSVADPASRLTHFEHDSAGNLTRIIDPDASDREFTYDGRHRMVTQTTKTDFTTIYTYDHAGRIAAATLPDGAVRQLFNAQSAAVVDTSSGPGSSAANPVPFLRATDAITTYVDAEGRVKTYEMDLFGRPRSITFENGASGLTTTIDRDNPDGHADFITRPSGEEFNPEFDDRGNLVSIEDVQLSGTTAFGGYDTIPINYVKTITDSRSQMTILTYDPANLDSGNVTRVTTPEIRVTDLTYTSDGLVETVLDSLGTTATMTYDPVTRNLTQIEQGTGLAPPRLTTLTYDGAGNVETILDAEGHLTTLAYDVMGRVTSQTLTHQSLLGTQIVTFGYDDAGQLESLTPPGQPPHDFEYDDRDRESLYDPPPTSPADPATAFAYNLESQLTSLDRPDLQSLELTYDVLGRLDNVTIQPANQTYALAYDDTSGLLESSDTPGTGPSLTFGYEGTRLVSETLSGAFTTAVTVSWMLDGDGRIKSRTVAGDMVAFTYDGDGLLTGAGMETLTRNPTTGLLSGTALGSVTTAATYNAFGERDSDATDYSATSLYANSYIRDKLGRIAQKTETVQGGASLTFDYSYDFAGRLEEVETSGAVTSTVSYTYDANGNRVSRSVLGGSTESATYDDQDRLLTHGDLAFTYSENGDLESKTDTVAVETTDYVYDARGNLRTVDLPDGRQVSYEVDGRDRQVARRVDGAFERGLVYGDALNPVAEVDASGTVVSRFVYGSRSNVPDYMIQGTTTYRILSDQLGSARLVVNTSTGAVAQRIDYDEFGDPDFGTYPADFQPFGFAGGLYDPDTELVRFGARDYDPRVGRWTAKDPIRFAGGDANLYAYAGNDPVNRIDPSGLDDRPFPVNGVVRNAPGGSPVFSVDVDNRTVTQVLPGGSTGRFDDEDFVVDGSNTTKVGGSTVEVGVDGTVTDVTSSIPAAIRDLLGGGLPRPATQSEIDDVNEILCEVLGCQSRVPVSQPNSCPGSGL